MVLPDTHARITAPPLLLPTAQDDLFYIEDPWDPRWETGVVGKLYRKNQPGSPVSTIKIQRKYVSMTQPLDIKGVGDIIKHSETLTPLTFPP